MTSVDNSIALLRGDSQGRAVIRGLRMVSVTTVQNAEMGAIGESPYWERSMKDEGSTLTVTERLLLERSWDDALTRRRVRLVVASAVLLVAALIVLAPLMASWQTLLFFAVAYVLVTAWERVAYARTILTYKGLIRKLARRIEELEGRPTEVSGS